MDGGRGHRDLGGRTGLVAVITGASRGLGAGMAEAFSDQGVRLGLCARVRPAPPRGAVAVSSSVDVTEPSSVNAFAASVVGRFGHIDLWINNAGLLAPVGPLADADPEELRRHVDTNVLGVLYGSAAFARHLRTRPGGGVLVNISSGAATTPYVGWAAYGGSKAAVDMITAVVVREERAHGLKGYALAPGPVDTDMQALIRSTPVGVFPAADRFRHRYQRGALNSPRWVAHYILDRLVDGAIPADPVEVDTVRVRVPDEVPGG